MARALRGGVPAPSPGRPRCRLLQLLAAAGAALFLACCRGQGQAWVPQPAQRDPPAASTGLERRAALGTAAAGFWGVLVPSEAVQASGGSTAGKYSTIPSAKRRFYGRVRQGIYQFLQLETPVTSGNFDDPAIEAFFAKTIVKEKGGEAIPVCMFSDCKTKEKRTSRWNDFKIASDLLASAFRYDASDVNDYLPQVKLIRAYHKKVEKMQKAIQEGDKAKAAQLFKNAKLDLSRYTPMVELAPISSEDYTHEWDTRPQIVCQDNFCT